MTSARSAGRARCSPFWASPASNTSAFVGEDGHEGFFYPEATRRSDPAQQAEKQANGNVLDLMRELAREQVGYELIPHGRSDTAVDEATAIGVPPQEVAKTLVLATADGYPRAVLPASERLDLRKVRKL
jgi:Aminoacyl-tRNA editing domain